MGAAWQGGLGWHGGFRVCHKKLLFRFFSDASELSRRLVEASAEAKLLLLGVGLRKAQRGPEFDGVVNTAAGEIARLQFGRKGECANVADVGMECGDFLPSRRVP